MLRPHEFERVLAAARDRAKRRSLNGEAARPVLPRVAPGRTRGEIPPARGQVRAKQSVQAPAGTGINPWWRYQEQNAPGGGHVMVNLGTGNMLLQQDDMSVPHKGVALAFRRTYNSQSGHDVAGTDGTPPGLYGNGWTNTFDAHLSGSRTGTMSVWDIDGARYDYTLAADGVTLVAPPGQHATLVSDGSYGYFWTKKSGTIYYFWAPDAATSWPSSVYQQFAAFAGRLYEIIGRNRNTNIFFSYSWDNGYGGPGGKISTITAQPESGPPATLTFGDVAGNRLLSWIQFPDGATYVFYGYDAQGNLVWVSPPANNAAGNRPAHEYGYQAQGSGTVLWWTDTPRWYAGCASSCGSDGGFLAFQFTGNSPSTSAISTILHGAVVNPVISDTSGTAALQSGYPTGGLWWYLTEYYTTGAATPTFRDTDGHMTNWVVDSLGRPMQTQECTASTNQGQQCTGQWLVTNESWDASNNLVSETDPRGYQTDYAYDANGNTVAVAEPSTAVQTGGGTVRFRPTQLFDYDQYDNVIAYCDQRASHPQGDWTPSGPPTAGGPDALCANNGSSAHAVFTYPLNPAPANEPFGRLTNIRSPLGYNRSIGYDPAQQGGADYGLPTSVRGDLIPQSDGSRTPSASLTYDASGNLICSMADGSDATTTTVLAYDALNRVTAIGDPDDASLTNGSCSKVPGIPGSAIVTRKTYFADGALATSQSPSEAAANVSTQFQYDLDGNETSEVHHHTGTPAVTQKWYDGADRLVEVQQPTDPNDFYTFAWTTRYLYDVTQGGTVAVGTSAPYRAYGGLFKTQELLPSSTGTPSWAEGGSTGTGPGSWQDTAGTSFDALDRAVTAYRNSSIGLMPKTNSYDAAGKIGQLSQTCNANNECQTFSYDERGLMNRIDFSVTSSATQTFAHDEDGRVATAQNAAGSISDLYDAEGRKSVRTQTVGAAAPSTLSYGYYADGMRSGISISGVASMPNALGYSYRPDGLIRRLTLPANASFNFAYTGGRRLTSRSDTTGQTPYTVSYSSPGSNPTSYGLPIAQNMPAWQESAMSYNAEGGQVGGNTMVLQSSGWSYGPLLAGSYTTRGEVVKELYVSDSQSGLPALFANGVRIPLLRSFGTPATGASGFDAKQSFPRWTRTANTCNSINRCNLTDSGTVENDTTTQYQYDAVGRQIGQQSFHGGYADQWQESIKTYDAQDHLLVDHRPNEHLYGGGKTNLPVDFSLGYVWGPLNHPLQIGSTSVGDGSGPSPTDFRYDALYWDDDSLLFTVNSAGAVDDLKVGDFADYVPGASNPLTVWDRSTDGQVHGCHSASGAGVVQTNTFQRVILACYAPSSFASPQYSAVNPAMVGRGALLTVPKGDGIGDGYNTIQGVRAFDTQAGVWSTPDAYRGNVHDPMSQKPFMWNRNNPYAYSDPSGYEAGCVSLNVQCVDDKALVNGVKHAYDLAIGSSLAVLFNPRASVYSRLFAAADIISNVVAPEKLGAQTLAKVGVKGVAYTAKAFEKVGVDAAHSFGGFVENAIFRYGTQKVEKNGYVKLQLDGTYKGHEGLYELGGFIDSNGVWLIDHHSFIAK